MRTGNEIVEKAKQKHEIVTETHFRSVEFEFWVVSG